MLLPVQLTAFVGREREVGDVARLLEASRLLTLTGAGGSGKTRLALAVAGRAEGHDVYWAELAGLSEPALVPQHVAEQLGLREERAGSATAALVALLRARPTLLVLDNCEHVVDAAARLVEALLRGCPALTVLATSREPLAIGGERAWLVPPLALPDPDAAAETVAASDAIRLFVERAGDVAPSFRLGPGNARAVAEICRRLDGLPLAIELAAARVRVLPPEELLARLRESFRVLGSGHRTAIPRHRTLRATIDWSYALLSPEEQRLLDHLSVFRGGFTLESAEAICGESDTLLDVLARLVDRSLVAMREVAGGARYALLETVRQYAAERLLARDEEAELRRRHAAFFLDLVAGAAPHLTTPGRRPWLDRLLPDIDNVRQMLAWTREHEPARHLRATGLLCWFWFSTGFWSEGRRWAEGALALPAAAAPTLDRAATLFAAAVIGSLQAEIALSRGWIDEALAIARAEGDRRLEAYASNYLGMVLIQQGKPEGEAPVRSAAAWFREHHDLYGLRLSLLMLGTLRVAQGDFARALVMMEEGVAVAREFGLPRELGIATQMLGSTLLRRGDPADLDRAAACLRESLAALREDPQHLFLARGLEMVGAVAQRRGAAAEAARLIGAADAMRERIGAAMFQQDRATLAPSLEALRAHLGDEAFERIRAEGRRLGLDEALALALARAVGGAPAAPAPPRVADGEPALIVRALGPLEIVCGDLRLERDGSSARARELLLYLLSHREGRTRAQIGLDFWPEASPAQVKNSFHVLLHRLRKALGRADVVVLDESYRVNPALTVWFDAEVFERLARKAGRDPRALAEARALYRGDFLDAEEAGDWHVAIRERLRMRLKEVSSTLAEVHLERGDAAAAAEMLERALQVDDLSEEVWRRLMVALARAGQRERALKAYERLARLLEKELDAAPEAATVALGRKLKRGEVL